MSFFPVLESDSNSDCDISGKKVKELKLLQSGSSKKEVNPNRQTKGPELLNTSTNHTATSCSPLNLQVIKSPTIVTSSSALAYHSSPGSSSYSLASPLGNMAIVTTNMMMRYVFHGCHIDKIRRGRALNKAEPQPQRMVRSTSKAFVYHGLSGALRSCKGML